MKWSFQTSASCEHVRVWTVRRQIGRGGAGLGGEGRRRSSLSSPPPSALTSHTTHIHACWHARARTHTHRLLGPVFCLLIVPPMPLLLAPHSPCPSHHELLSVPQTPRTPSTWDSPDVRVADSFSTLRSHLKCHLFKEAFLTTACSSFTPN